MSSQHRTGIILLELSSEGLFFQLKKILSCWITLICPKIQQWFQNGHKRFKRSGKPPDWPQIFHTLRKSSRLSGSSPYCLEILQAVWKFSKKSKNIRAKTVWKSSRLSETFSRLSRKILHRLEIFRTVLKFYRLSGNLSDYPEIFKTLWKSSRLSKNLPGCWEIIQTVRKIVQTICKSPRQSGNLQNCPKIFQTIQKFSRLSGNCPDWQKIFQAVGKSSRLFGKSFRLSGNLQNCPKIAKTIRKS